MSQQDKPPVGFVMPNGPPQQPAGYPQYPAQPGTYPSAQSSQPYNYHPQQPVVQYQQPGYQPFPPPVQHQPGNVMAPSGAWIQGGNFQNSLRNATSFHVKQKVELLEAFIGWETGNKYTVKDQAGNKVFYVGEESNVCGRQCCSSRRPFKLQVKDGASTNVLIMDRPFACSFFCGLCCPDEMTVSTPTGQLLGSVVEEFNILYPMFSLKDSTGRTALRIEGPICSLSFCGSDVIFKVLTLDGVAVGTISKHWSGLARELFTDADYFSISFPVDLDVSMKAVCLAALFLIDYEYFEAGAGDKQGGRRLFS